MELAGCFIKFGQLEHLKALRDNGLLFCNPVSFFLDIEDNGLRGDPMENVTHLNNIENGTLWMKPASAPDSEFKRLNNIHGKFKSWIDRPFGNLFCLYAINVLTQPLGTVYTIDARNKQFGGQFLLIHEPSEFLDRLRKTLIRRNIGFAYDMVQYLNLSKHNGQKSIFQKDLAYGYQREFRVFINNTRAEPLLLEIGSLADISSILDVSDIDTFALAAKGKDGNTVEIHYNKKLPI